jgi:hypothetical protein
MHINGGSVELLLQDRPSSNQPLPIVEASHPQGGRSTDPAIAISWTIPVLVWTQPTWTDEWATIKFTDGSP